MKWLLNLLLTICTMYQLLERPHRLMKSKNGSLVFTAGMDNSGYDLVCDEDPIG